MNYLYIYSILVNIVEYALFGLDKKRAIRRKWRVPEALLLFVAFMGGSLGGILAMVTFRHKTKKLKFKLGMPLLLILNLAAAYYIQELILSQFISFIPITK